ncbi:MAG TPA: hypothetical protein PK252_01340 [Bacteroidales bacterium]|nr:hypothetical protein [Bacteroidales bacterium]
MIKKGFITFCLVTLPFVTLSSQDTTAISWDGFFESAAFAQPFVSEMHSNVSKAELGYNKSYSEFDLLEEGSKFNRPMVELHAGFDIPLFANFSRDIDNKNKWGFAASVPVSVHVLEDMWGSETAPVINTDYRFGSFKLRLIRYFPNNRFIKNISFSWLPIFHECTHLGDEITIYRKDENFPITRINVSYEYTEFQATINDPDRIRENCHSLRLGFSYRISNRGLGWFSVRKDAELTTDLDIPASKYRGEYYLEYQFQRTQGFLASKRFVNVLSFEVRYRLRYGYPLFKKVDEGKWETTEVKEGMLFNFNLYWGYKFYPKTNFNHAVGFYFHGYRGLNPYGQLRNYPGYPFFGISLIYEL